jgi:hypothetical protein
LRYVFLLAAQLSLTRLVSGSYEAYLDAGVRAADRVVGEAAPALFDSEDMRAGVAGVLEHGVRNFRGKVVFNGR